MSTPRVRCAVRRVRLGLRRTAHSARRPLRLVRSETSALWWGVCALDALDISRD